MGSLGVEISWPSKKPQEKQPRIHNHHVSLRGRSKELQSRSHRKHPRAHKRVHGGQETAKAVAWAVFQHHGEGGAGHGHTHGMAGRRPTRFKIEAQMKHEVAHRSVCEAVAFRWDAGSTLFDSFELSSLLKTLDEAAHARRVGSAEQSRVGEDSEEAGAMVVYSPKSPTACPQLHPPLDRHSRWSLGNHGEGEDRGLDTVDEMGPSKPGQGQRGVRYSLTGNVKHGHGVVKDDSFSVIGNGYGPTIIGRRSLDSSHSEKPAMGGSHVEKPAMGGSHDHHHHHHHHHKRWKSLLHTLHLDGANGLFHGFHKSHTQVSPHDFEKSQEHRGRSHRDGHEGHSERNVSRSEKEHDHHHHHHRHRHPHFWTSSFKAVLTHPFCRPGHPLSDNEGSDSETSHKAGHKKYHGHKHADLRAAWSSLTANLLHHHHHHHEHKRHHEVQGDGQSVIEHHHHHHHEHKRHHEVQGDGQSVIEHHHHHHHHHHHVQPEGEDDEMTVQAISMRVARTSFDEKARRLSSEEGGLKAPRNSLEAPIWA